jgi:hypothetical protein
MLEAHTIAAGTQELAIRAGLQSEFGGVYEQFKSGRIDIDMGFIQSL